MATTKPSVQRPWADTGTKTPAPNDSRRNTGYVHNDMPTIPELNALLSELTSLERYVMQVGISDWDAAETYGINNIVRDPTDGELYVCDVAAPVVGTRPGLSSTHWAPYYRRVRSVTGSLTQELIAWRNARSLRRFGISHQGFDAGNIYRWDENWDLPLAQQFAATARWNSFLNGGTVNTFDPGSGGLLFPSMRTVRITPTTGAANSTFVLKTRNVEIFMSDDTAVEIEVAIAMSEIGTNRTTISFGLSDGFSASTHGVVVGKTTATPNWQLSTVDGGTAGTTIPPVANTPNYMKIELLGASQSDSGIATANLYIDGVFAANVDNPVANGSGLFPVFGATTTTTGGAAVGVAFSSVRLRASTRSGNNF